METYDNFQRSSNTSNNTLRIMANTQNGMKEMNFSDLVRQKLLEIPVLNRISNNDGIVLDTRKRSGHISTVFEGRGQHNGMVGGPVPPNMVKPISRVTGYDNYARIRRTFKVDETDILGQGKINQEAVMKQLDSLKLKFSKDLFTGYDSSDTGDSAGINENNNFYGMLDWLDPARIGKTLFNIDRKAHDFMRADHKSCADISSDGSDISMLSTIFDIAHQTGCLKTPTNNAQSEAIVNDVQLSYILDLLKEKECDYELVPTNDSSLVVRSLRFHDQLKITKFDEWVDDKIAIIQWPTWRFLTDGLVTIVKNLDDGKEWMFERTPDGNTNYTLICDIIISGQLVCKKPWANGLITNLKPIV